jgi:hypothetical protein
MRSVGSCRAARVSGRESLFYYFENLAHTYFFPVASNKCILTVVVALYTIYCFTLYNFIIRYYIIIGF